MTRTRVLALITLLVVIFAYLAISWYFSSLVVVFVSDNYAQQDIFNTELASWEVEGDVEVLEIQSGDNTIIAEVYDNPADADCGVITVHGLGGRRSIVRLAGPQFYDLGCDVMTFDFAYRTNDLFLTYGVDESIDLSNLIQWFADYSDLPESNIGIWSESYGGATAILALQNHPDIAFAVVDSTYSSLMEQVISQGERDYGAIVHAFVPPARFIAEQRAGFSFADAAPVDAIGNLDIPVLLIHSQQDNLIVPANSERIYAAANQNQTELVLTDWGAVHARSISADPAAYTALVYDFLATYAPDFGNQIP